MVVVELSLPSAFSVLDQWCRWYSECAIGRMVFGVRWGCFKMALVWFDTAQSTNDKHSTAL